MAKGKSKLSMLWLLERCNRAFTSETLTAGERQTIANVLGDALHETGNYCGYCYLKADEHGEFTTYPSAEEVNAEEFDRTRRSYYYSDTLRAEQRKRDEQIAEEARKELEQLEWQANAARERLRKAGF